MLAAAFSVLVAVAGADALDGPGVGFTAMGGVALPGCSGQTDSCTGSLGPAPSVAGLVLYQPNRTWGFGVMGQLARLHWRAMYTGMVDGSPGQVDSDVTTAFAGLAARVTFLPERMVSPVAQLALGSAFQMQTGSNFGCNDGFIPTGHVGVGARARVSPSLALFAMASASAGIKGGCSVSDGPPATPFAGWGYGLHAGASFDLPFDGAAPARVAAR